MGAIKHITNACCRTGFPLRSKPAANAGRWTIDKTLFVIHIDALKTN